MRLSDLYGTSVRSRDGRRLGRVREVLCEGGEVTHLGIGVASWMERLTGRRHGRRIPWSAVAAVKRHEILVEA